MWLIRTSLLLVLAAEWSATTEQTLLDPEVPVTLNIKPFKLQDVRLESSSAFYQATQLNRQYLLMLEPDRLLYSFRQTANLSTQGAQPYGGWISANSEVRGHFTGHFLSATAMMWASTGDEQVGLSRLGLRENGL